MLHFPSFLRPSAAWSILIGLVIIGFFIPVCAPIVHETDQVELLTGALEIAQTGKLTGQTFYNYDKQYGTYWILAFACKILNLRLDGDAILWMGSVLSSIALLFGLWLMGRFIAAWDQFLLQACVLLTPSLLMHGPFLATNYFSAGFLCLQFFFLHAKGRGKWLVPLFAFCAVACRADAIFLQPILFWTAVEEFRISALLKSRLMQITALSCGLALALGKAIVGKSYPSFLPIFDGKTFAAYAIFGLGSVVLLLLLVLIVFLKRIHASKGERGFLILGMLFFFLPFGFYAVQLYSTRHWTIGLFCLAFFFGSQKGVGMVRGYVDSSRCRKLIYPVLAGAALVPLFIGIRMPLYPKFEFTLTKPTLYPSADGLQPMGAYLARAWGWDRENRLIPDYNQATWLAAKSTDFLPTAEGVVPVIRGSPAAPILQFAIIMQQKDFKALSIARLEEYGFLYVDHRYLRRGNLNLKRELPALDDTRLPYAMIRVSPTVESESIEMLLPGKNERRQVMEILKARFANNDFVMEEGELSEVPREIPDFAGRQVVVISPQPFSLAAPDGSMEISTPATEPEGRWNILEIPQTGQKGYKLYGNRKGQRYVRAVSGLPTYMSIKNYNGTP